MSQLTPSWIKKNIPLKDYTTFKIGGRAKYFAEIQTQNQLIGTLKWAQAKNLPLFIIGNGSNVLFSDKGFKGLVIKLNNNSFVKKNLTTVLVGAGLMVGNFLEQCVKNNLSGYEWLAGIPGTMGGVVYGNAGAFGNEIKNFVKKVITLNPSSFKIKKYSLTQCKFDYRESIFKKNKEIILAAELRIKKGNKNDIQKKIQENWQYKISHHLFDYPSAGSIFKNIIIQDTIYKKYYDSKHEKVKILNEEIGVKGGKVSAGYFIEKTGLKGYQIGGAKIADFHANVIINIKNARAQDVLKLISLIKRKVYQKFKIKLEEEVAIVK
ncbi:MAG: UDP-N-acetylmuramate dehydrogenase [Parcubacteria group bacterium]|nr:UDP-N-acetylmuramate dehydrogenase [Parcubacteria group bacterium]